MSDMTFRNRLSGRMAESIVRAVLEHARYRIIDSGIECLIREISVMDHDAYRELRMPDAIRALPDFTVLDRDQNNKWLVEVKYRKIFDFMEIIKIVEHQVKLFDELTVALVIAEPPGEERRTPARYLRGFRLRYVNQRLEAELRLKDKKGWYTIAEAREASWWSTRPLPEIFTQLDEQKDERTITDAVDLIAGLVRTERRRQEE